MTKDEYPTKLSQFDYLTHLVVPDNRVLVESLRWAFESLKQKHDQLAERLSMAEYELTDVTLSPDDLEKAFAGVTSTRLA